MTSRISRSCSVNHDEQMPERGTVDPLFDGHLERPLLALSPEERLDWIWEMMELVRLARPEGGREGDERSHRGG